MCLKILTVSQLYLAVIGWFDLERLGGIDLVGGPVAYWVVWSVSYRTDIDHWKCCAVSVLFLHDFI